MSSEEIPTAPIQHSDAPTTTSADSAVQEDSNQDQTKLKDHKRTKTRKNHKKRSKKQGPPPKFTATFSSATLPKFLFQTFVLRRCWSWRVSFSRLLEVSETNFILEMLIFCMWQRIKSTTRLCGRNSSAFTARRAWRFEILESFDVNRDFILHLACASSSCWVRFPSFESLSLVIRF